jgi:hypothetical protein
MTLGTNEARGVTSRRRSFGRRVDSDVRDARARESVVVVARESVDVRAEGTIVDGSKRPPVDEETAARARGNE